MSSDQYDAPPPRGQWALAWRRLKRDRVALGCGVFLVVLVFAVGPGAPLYERIVGHGPNDPFPYAVSVQLRPSGPLTVTWDTSRLADTDPYAFKHKDPPKGTGKTLLTLGADSSLGRDEFLRVLYGGRVSLEVAVGAAVVALLIGVTLGSLAGYVGGVVDALISRLTDLVMAFPLLLFLVMVGSVFTNGITRWTFGGQLRVIRAHALQNAIAPVVTMLAMDAGIAIGIAMYVETVFGLPGLGRTLIGAEVGLQGYDLPVILAVTLVAGAAIILLNLVADLVVLALDPTLARSSRRRLLRLSGRTA